MNQSLQQIFNYKWCQSIASGVVDVSSPYYYGLYGWSCHIALILLYLMIINFVSQYYIQFKVVIEDIL